MKPACLIDAIRERYPHLPLALYAYEPGGPVTLEVIGPDDRPHTAIGKTAELAIAKLFPEIFEAAPAPEAAPPEPEPDINLFD